MITKATELGVSGVMNVIRQVLVDQYAVERPIDQIGPRDELFEKGLGLSSLQGLTLLLTLEERFGVSVNEIEWSMHEVPTVEAVATYIVRLAEESVDVTRPAL